MWCGEVWGDVGRCGVGRCGVGGVGRCGVVWGDVGRCGVVWGGVGRCEVVWGGVGRCGMIQIPVTVDGHSFASLYDSLTSYPGHVGGGKTPGYETGHGPNISSCEIH